MSDPNSGYYDGDGIALDATLLITTSSSSSKYGRLWRRYLLVRIFISRSHVSSSFVPLPDQDQNQLPRTSSTHIEIHSDPEEAKVDEEKLLISDCLPLIVKHKDLDLLKNIGGIARIASVLGSNLETGIDARRVSSQLSNTNLVPVRVKGFIYYFLKGLNSFTIFLLFVAAFLSFAVEMIEQGAQHGWHDGVAILVAVFLIVTFRSVSNLLHERKLQKKLLEAKIKLEVEVIRSGELHILPIADVVVGDLLHLKEGDIVPAEGLFVSGGGGLVLDGVVNPKIDCDTNPFLCSGSKVKYGHGRMIVISISANITPDNPAERTFLGSKIEKLDSFIEILGLSVSVLIALVILVGLLSKRQHKNDDILPELKGTVSIDVLMDIFESMFWRPTGTARILTGYLTAIVIGMQHGMLFVITVSLSYWNEKVESYQVKPQKCSACGTMGLVTVICINATDGLLCSQMEVNKLLIGREDMNARTVDSEIDQVVLESLHQGIRFCSRAPEMSVSPTNKLLAVWAKSRWGANVELSDQGFSVLDHGSLGSNKNSSRVLLKKNQDNEGPLYLHLNGDASTVLNFCSHYHDSMGEIHSIQGQRKNFDQVIEEMENSGLIALAFAYKQIETRDSSEEGSRLLAVIGLKYSFQDIAEALRHAKVSIKLLSQDKPSAIRDLARKLGIIRPGSNNVELEGEQIRDLTTTDRMKRIEEAIVIGSCTSEDMVLVVQSLQENGHVVAFFGGLTNSDTPALRKADIGIAKERLSTEIAKQSSDIIISDEGSIPQVLKFGRYAYYNIQKFSQLQLTACISGLLVNLGAAICSWDSPLTPIQLFWVNFVMCLLGGLMMVMELRSQDLLTNSPAKRAEPLVTKAIWKDVATQAVFQTSLLLILHLVGKVTHSTDEDVWKSLVFNSFTLCQVFNQFNAMGILKKDIAISVLHNHWFLLALGAVMGMQVLMVEFATSLAGCERLNVVHWAFSFLIAALPWGLGSAVEFIPVSLLKWSYRSHGSHHGFARRPLLLVSYLGIPFSMIFLFSMSYYFYPNKAQIFRR